MLGDTVALFPDHHSTAKHSGSLTCKSDVSVRWQPVNTQGTVSNKTSCTHESTSFLEIPGTFSILLKYGNGSRAGPVPNSTQTTQNKCNSVFDFCSRMLCLGIYFLNLTGLLLIYYGFWVCEYVCLSLFLVLFFLVPFSLSLSLIFFRHLFSNERLWIWVGGGGSEDLGGVEEAIRIYCMKKIIFNKKTKNN